MKQKMETPLISVIVPIYNVEQYLEKCLDSICNQTYRNLEILLVNDGSPDLSKEICQQYLKKDERIILINKKNGGLASARNAALKVLKGDIVVCVDSDDWIECNMVEVLYNNLRLHDADMSVCNYFTELGEGKRSNKRFTQEVKVLDNVEAMEYAILPQKYYGFAWNKMYKKEVLGNLLYDEAILKGEDSPFSCEYISRCKKVVYQDIPLYHYRQDTISISRSKFTKKKMTVLKSYSDIVNMLIKKGYEERIVELQKVQYANQLLSLLVNITDTDRKQFIKEYDQIRKEMKKYKQLYIKSPDIDKLHKLTYICGMNSRILLDLLCKCKNRR